ncbi:MerR family transcriptional regulator [Shinella zoogloeoides]|uniref:MerR family transcriptional regulator n=1 Tax=Shinella zoogloeoides TaxID=352475 RepID=UPI00273D7CA4|nr:MerR family transcriptional regulator [Shinella zoogloeoides]WLR92325.1 MerR family transcriptional regulator [Shinella zoogloeoides]
MRKSGLHLTAAEAARELGISAKALRLYERHGLLAPLRTAAGWRIYGPSEMARARDIVALRRLDMGLSQIKHVFSSGAEDLKAALARHQAGLKRQLDRIAETVQSVEAVRDNLTATANATEVVSLALPWPWGGERFELPALAPITYITGPLGSGKTRLARAIAQTVPNAAFIGLERLDDGGAVETDARSDAHLRMLAAQGADPSPALTALVAAMERSAAAVLVVDMVEQGLDQATQQVLRHYLRLRPFGDRPLFLLTRSSSILDLADIRVGESILYCPANHDVPMAVVPRKGARGYEAVAMCLATPAVRSRTEGVIASRPSAA